MSGSHLIQSLRGKQKNHRKYSRIPVAKKWGKKEKKTTLYKWNRWTSMG